MKNNIFLFVLILLIVAGASFYAGTKYKNSKIPTDSFDARFNGNPRGPGMDNGNLTMNRRAGGGRQTIGEIISQDDKSITVKMQDNSTKIVILSDKTTIIEATTAAITNLKVGTKVGVFGMENSDGSVTAQNIQINPVFRNPQKNQQKP